MKINTTIEKFHEGISTIRKMGGDVTVDYLDSTSEGKVEAEGVTAKFEFNQGDLTIKIIDKPFFATDSMIEDKINEFFK